jgi:hypothetical protein
VEAAEEEWGARAEALALSAAVVSLVDFPTGDHFDLRRSV